MVFYIRLHDYGNGLGKRTERRVRNGFTQKPTVYKNKNNYQTHWIQDPAPPPLPPPPPHTHTHTQNWLQRLISTHNIPVLTQEEKPLTPQVPNWPAALEWSSQSLLAPGHTQTLIRTILACFLRVKILIMITLKGTYLSAFLLKSKY